MKKSKIIALGIAIGVGALLLIVFIAYYYEVSELSNLSDEELRSLSVDWEYDDILRNPGKYEFEIIHFEGPIVKVDPFVGDNYYLHVRTDCQPLGSIVCDDFVVDYTGKQLLVDDLVEVYALLDYVEDVPIIGTEVSAPFPHVTAIRLNCLTC